MFIILLFYFLIIIYIITKSCYVFNKTLYKTKSFKENINLISMPFYLNNRKIHLCLFFLNLILLIFTSFNLLFDLNITYLDIEEMFGITIAQCYGEITSYDLKKIPKIMGEGHQESAALNDSLYKSFLNTEDLNKINLKPRVLGRNYLDNYEWGTTNRYITSINQVTGEFIQRDLQTPLNIYLFDDSKIVTDRPYLKYLAFFNNEYRNFHLYNMEIKNLYLNYPNIIKFLTETPAIMNNLVVDYLKSYPYVDTESRITCNEMSLLFENIQNLYIETFLYLEGPVRAYNYGVDYDFNKDIEILSKIHFLSNENINSLNDIFKHTYKQNLDIKKADSYYYPCIFREEKD